MKNKGLITVLIFGALVLFGGVWACNKRNSFVGLHEDAKKQWQQVESQYQRRSDLIPNIVATVKGEANFEQSTLEAVVSARARATQTTINPDNLNEKSIEKYKAVQGELSGALSRLLMVTENYPNLKANAAFADLRVTLEGTENRISVERMKYNDVCAKYNKAIQFFPGNLLAGGFAPMPYFESEAGSETAPKVEF
ncbi:MAG: LemA family protein [Bacteroidetes bacterium]|nr:LemA family protein [Bacteroidota bacterium]